MIPAVTSFPLAFLFDLHFTTIPRFDSKRYQMVLALSIIWQHTAECIKQSSDKTHLASIKQNNNFSTSNNLFIYTKMPFNKSNLTNSRLPFPDERRIDFTECSQSHSCDQCTRSGRENVVHYKKKKKTVNVNQREKDLNIFYFTLLPNLHVNQ